MDLEKYERIKKEVEAKELIMTVKPSLVPKSKETKAPEIKEVQAEIPEYLKTLTIAEAVKLPEFKESLNEVMSKSHSFRDEFMYKLEKCRLKNDVIRWLDDMDEWNIDDVTRIYLGCLNKSLDTSRYSARTRQFITRVGDTAINLMVNKLKEKENRNEKAV